MVDSYTAQERKCRSWSNTDDRNIDIGDYSRYCVYGNHYTTSEMQRALLCVEVWRGSRVQFAVDVPKCSWRER
jgi:hypothetical protein